MLIFFSFQACYLITKICHSLKLRKENGEKKKKYRQYFFLYAKNEVQSSK